MNASHRLICTLFLLITPALGWSQSSFQKNFSTTQNLNVSTVKQTTDGGYIVCGTLLLDSANSDVFLLKTTATGDTTWFKHYGGPANEFGEAVVQTPDGGYAVAGIINSAGAGLADVYVFKTNPIGDTLWTRAFGGSGDELGQSIANTRDTCLLITGHSDTFGPRGDFYVLKLKATGDTIWTKTYGGLRHDHGYSGQQTSDGGYVCAGHSLSFGSSGGYYVVKTNAFGDTLWTKGYGGKADSYCYSISQTREGGYILGGYTNAFGAGQSDFWILRTNSTGDTLWSRTYGGTGADICSCVKQTRDGGFVLLGTTTSFGFGNSDVYLVKIDPSGRELWSKTYGGLQNDAGYDLDTTSDGGFIIGAASQSFVNGINSTYLIKTDSNGNSGCHQVTPPTLVLGATPTVFPLFAISGPAHTLITATHSLSAGVFSTPENACLLSGIKEVTPGFIRSISVFPNPTSGLFQIQCPLYPSWLEVYDTLGRLVFQTELKLEIQSLDLRIFPRGVYILGIRGVHTRILITNQ
jgi:hypothetical protein